MTPTPIFLFSAPRAGSTLTQRVLAAHPQIATVSEPWILLPLLLPLYGDRHRIPTDPPIPEAIEDFFSELPSGVEDYRNAVRELAGDLYARASDGPSRYFLDKTPLYHLIVDEIARTFPDSKFIFLWRNPLSLVASAVELFDAGRWEVNRYVMGLFQSIADLAPASQRYRDRSVAVRYEDLVSEAPCWELLMEHLDLELEPSQLEQFNAVALRGRMGDQSGALRYSGVSSEPVEKWKAVINNPVRKAWCARYLRWIGRDRLATMGYDMDRLLVDLAAVPASVDGTLDDSLRLAGSMIRELAKARIRPHAGGPSVWRALLR